MKAIFSHDGGASLKAEPDRTLFRVVIGCYSNHNAHWIARQDLRSSGIKDEQICSVGSREAFLKTRSSDDSGGSRLRTMKDDILYSPRNVRHMEVQVSSARLFDHLWPAPHHHEGSLARWMTLAQSDAIWRSLCEDCPLLMVSADSPQQQIQNSRIQLRHMPVVMQAFNFAR
jgi:hypothetical protein